MVIVATDKMADKGKQWSHGLCGCFDNCGICIMTWFLPCVTFGKNMEALGENCCLYGLCYFIDPVGFAAAVHMRHQIRQRAGIAGSFTNDILMSCFCGFCTLVQEAQELQEMGLSNKAIPLDMERQ